MARIRTNDLKPGMILLEDAVHSNGRVLLKAGAVLTEKHIKIFKTWGVINVEIQSGENNSNATPEHYSKNQIDNTINEMHALFLHCDMKHPFINELFRLSVKVRLINQTRKPDELDS